MCTTFQSYQIHFSIVAIVASNWNCIPFLGNLYYEKAVDGFLSELFDRWQGFGSSHEVTIVLFSRVFYDVDSKHAFPKAMRECIQASVDGRFYEDFYRVVVQVSQSTSCHTTICWIAFQNERFDDWKPTLVMLRKIISDYDRFILTFHHDLCERLGRSPPKSRISTAEKGNFLEVLNMSLNTFENHYLNRNLDRTGQQSIVLTPGEKWKRNCTFKAYHHCSLFARGGHFRSGSRVDSNDETEIDRQRRREWPDLCGRTTSPCSASFKISKKRQGSSKTWRLQVTKKMPFSSVP